MANIKKMEMAQAIFANENISVEKTFEGKKPRTICRITPVGLNAFENYVDALKSYLK